MSNRNKAYHILSHGKIFLELAQITYTKSGPITGKLNLLNGKHCFVGFH